MPFHVLEKQCDQCLYGPNKIVPEKRRKELLRGLATSDNHFICHKATLAGKEVACRADWDRRGCGQLGRIAGRIGAVKFVPESELTPT